MTPASSTTTDSFAEAPRRIPGWVRLAVLLVAAAFRLWALDLRPPHFDEGVNGMFTDHMQRTGFYRYDPTNYHGPLHFYVLFLFKCLLGRNLWALRLPEALIGILTVDWIFRFRRYLDPRVCAWAALAMAVSPGFTFFNRYAIHETWLVFFIVLGAWGALGLWTDGTRRALWAAGLAAAGMILTKETYVIHFAGLAIATGSVVAAGRLVNRRIEPAALQLWSWSDLAAVAGVGLFAILFFYSGAGYNPKGIAGLVMTFLPWAHKAGQGEGHSKPFIYWWRIFLRNEPWAWAGLLAAVRYAAWPSRLGPAVRLLAIYALAVFVAYSFIPYKTPWCVISIAWPFVFLAAAAVGEASLLGGRLGEVIGCAVAAGVIAWSGYLAWDLNFRRCTDFKESYVYVHTYDSVNEITGPLYDIARENPANYCLEGTVIGESVHPLPWLLGDFSRMSYYTRASSKKHPPNYRSDFLIVTQDRAGEVERKLDDDYFKQKLTLRPSLAPMYLYLRASIFEHLMPEREPEFHPAPPPALDPN